jgi:hypothetical protein
LRFRLPLRRRRCVPLLCQRTFAKIESLLSDAYNFSPISHDSCASTTLYSQS